MTAESLDISFEYFPPAKDDAAPALMAAATRLAGYAPEFASITYGAGGTTQTRTLTALRTMGKALDVPLAGHLTCVGATAEQTLSVARAYRAMGVSHIVALRGDPPAGKAFAPHPGGFASAAELVAALREDNPEVQISVAGYPEIHPQAASRAEEIAYLKRKCEAGADRILTQFFFDNDDFLRFVDDCADAGITTPVVPGIMPVRDFAGLQRFAKRCGATIPPKMVERFEKAAERDCVREIALAYAAGQCDDLRSAGVRQFHFYTMNSADLTSGVLAALGVEAQAAQVTVAA